MSAAKSQPLSCPLCQGTTLTRKITTYPMRTFDGRQINIGRVAVQECDNCHHLIPTKAGSEKVNRCMATMAQLFFGD
jgi:YgiT-type zinc finger domain-containing protein